MATIVDGTPSQAISLTDGDNAWQNINGFIAQTGEAFCDNTNKNETPQTLAVLDFFNGVSFDFSTQPTITGIVLRVLRGRSGDDVSDSLIQFAINSSAVGQNKASGAIWPTSNQFASYGGAGDTWGIDQSELNAIFQRVSGRQYQFNPSMSAMIRPTDGTASSRVSSVELTIFYSVFGLKVWNGSQWVTGDVKYAATSNSFNNTQSVKVWDGLRWLDCAIS